MAAAVGRTGGGGGGGGRGGCVRGSWGWSVWVGAVKLA